MKKTKKTEYVISNGVRYIKGKTPMDVIFTKDFNKD